MSLFSLVEIAFLKLRSFFSFLRRSKILGRFLLQRRSAVTKECQPLRGILKLARHCKLPKCISLSSLCQHFCSVCLEISSKKREEKKKRILNVKFQLYHNIESYIHSNYIRNEDQPLLRKKAMLSRVNIHSKRKSTQATYSK